MSSSKDTSILPLSYPTYNAASLAMLRLRSRGKLEGMIAKVAHSPYGGYQIKKMPVDLYVDIAATGGLG